MTLEPRLALQPEGAVVPLLGRKGWHNPSSSLGLASCQVRGPGRQMAPFLREKITEAGPLLPMLPGAGAAGVDTRSQPVLPTSLGVCSDPAPGAAGWEKRSPRAPAVLPINQHVSPAPERLSSLGTTRGAVFRCQEATTEGLFSQHHRIRNKVDVAGIGSQSDSHHKPRNLEMGRRGTESAGLCLSHGGAHGGKSGTWHLTKAAGLSVNSCSHGRSGEPCTAHPQALRCERGHGGGCGEGTQSPGGTGLCPGCRRH